jgi:prophage regulatory protein
VTFSSPTMLVMLDLYSMSADPDPSSILRIDEVLEVTGLKKTMLYELINREEFPRQVHLGGRAVGWQKKQVLDWNRNRPVKMRKTKFVGRGAGEVNTPAPRPRDACKAKGNRAKAVAATVIEGKLNQKATVISARSVSGVDKSENETVRPSPVGKGPFYVGTTQSPSKTVSAPDEVKHLREENARLKKLLGAQVLKIDMLQSEIRDYPIHS